MPDAAPAMPPNPRSPATSARIKNVIDQPSMLASIFAAWTFRLFMQGQRRGAVPVPFKICLLMMKFGVDAG